MSHDNPIQTPVTGHENSSDQTEARQALAQFYRALNTRDLELMQRNWVNSREAAMDNPLGGIKRSWNEIKAVYQKLFESKGTFRFEFYDYTLYEANDLFYVVGRERGELDQGAKPMRLLIRTSRIFRRQADRKWRQVHHHGSIDDPKMLADYQKAILGKTLESAA